jgi:hypothetical protein
MELTGYDIKALGLGFGLEIEVGLRLRSPLLLLLSLIYTPNPNPNPNSAIITHLQPYHPVRYDMHSILGHNCRFLQGEDTDSSEVQKLTLAIEQGREEQVVIKYYRKG